MGSKTIRILGRDYKVQFKGITHAAGYCDRSQGLIVIADGQDAHEQKDTLLHEVFHAILHQQGREDGGETEEVYVRALATGLIAVLADNPKFAKLLLAPT